MALDLELRPVADAAEGFALEPDRGLAILELESPIPTEPPGQPQASFGFAAVEGVLRAGSLCLEGGADCMVTPPIHKESMHLAGYPYEGQTQILGELCRSRRYGMLACAGKLKVLPATRHMALRQVLQQLDVQGLAKQIRIAHEGARQVLGLTNPRIVLSALNPHAGEAGAFGDEEEKILQPAMEMAADQWGFETSGPAVPDVVFRQGAEGRWDVVIALYHDQAFLPLKMLDWKSGYTVFVGGPILRVSPTHGAAYDIAGRGLADARPLENALHQGLELSRHCAWLQRPDPETAGTSPA